MHRKINAAIIIICLVLIMASAVYWSAENTEPFWSDILLVILLKQPCAAVTVLTETIQLKFQNQKIELEGAIISAVILCGMGTMSLLMTLQTTAEVRAELLVTLAINAAVTAVLYIKMRKGKDVNDGIT